METMKLLCFSLKSHHFIFREEKRREIHREPGVEAALTSQTGVLKPLCSAFITALTASTFDTILLCASTPVSLDAVARELSPRTQLHRSVRRVGDVPPHITNANSLKGSERDREGSTLFPQKHNPPIFHFHLL